MIYNVILTLALLALALWLAARGHYGAAGLVVLVAIVRFV